jgi:hypothetical protein
LKIFYFILLNFDFLIFFVENSEQETGGAIENGDLTPLATDIANISIQMKNVNDRFDQISTESKQFKEINSELENQIA